MRILLSCALCFALLLASRFPLPFPLQIFFLPLRFLFDSVGSSVCAPLPSLAMFINRLFSLEKLEQEHENEKRSPENSKRHRLTKL